MSRKLHIVDPKKNPWATLCLRIACRSWYRMSNEISLVHFDLLCAKCRKLHIDELVRTLAQDLVAKTAKPPSEAAS